MEVVTDEKDGLYLENLEEYIYDDEKIVTYKWLSRTLSVHVNEAKQMLYTFVGVQNRRNPSDRLSVVYLLAGVTQEEGITIHKIQLVPELSLDGAKSRLHPITSCHVYSVQRAPLKDSNALYMADLDLQQTQILNSNKCSAIKCMGAKIRSQEAIDSLRSTPEQPASPVKQITKTSTSNGTTAKTNTGGATGMFAKTNTGGATGMFAKAQQKAAKKTETPPQGGAGDDKIQSSKQTSKSTGNQKSRGLQSFFGKQGSKPKCAEKPAGGRAVETNTVKSTKQKAAGKEASTKSRKKKVLDSHEEGKRCIRTSIATSKQITKLIQPLSSKQPEYGPTSEEPIPQQQKRRRIRLVSESSSSEEDMDPESPPPSPPPAREPSPPRSPSPLPTQPEKTQPEGTTTGGEKHRGRKRKLVSKTTVNEEGYMVTEKVWEYESMDESEETDATKPDVASKETTGTKKPSVASKVSSPPSKAHRKQASLMSFFKKK